MIKIPPYRSEKYKAFVRTLPCSHCGRSADHAHHIKIMGVGGRGVKPPDSTCMPLCWECHADVHKGPANYPQTRWMIETQARAFYEGVLK